MSVHQVHPRSTFQKQFRTRPSDSKKQNATFLSVRTAVLRRGLCRGSVQRHTLFCEIPCVADGKLPFSQGSVQRYTFSRGKACIATAGYRKKQKYDATTHPFLRNSLCRKRETAGLQRFRAATHHFKKKNLYRDSRIQEKQWHNAATHPFLQDSLYRGRITTILPRFRAATHHFLQDSLYREKEIVPAPKTNTPRLHGTPQKMSARIGND